MDFTLEFDPERKVLLVAMGRVVTGTSAEAAAAAVRQFFELHDTNCIIADLSTVERIDTSADFVSFLAEGPPAVPTGILTILIAPRDEAYGLCRMFQTIRMDRTEAEDALQVVRSREEAYAVLGCATRSAPR